MSRAPSLSRFLRRLGTICAEIEEAQGRARKMGVHDAAWLLEESKKAAMEAQRRVVRFEAALLSHRAKE